MASNNFLGASLSTAEKETLQYLRYDQPKDRLVASKPVQTTEDSLYYGETLKSNVIGDEVGYDDLISGNSVFTPFRVFNSEGSFEPVLVTRLFIDPAADAQGWQTFQSDDTGTITLAGDDVVTATFTQLKDAWNFGYRLKGNYGKLAFTISSPEFGNPTNYLKVYDSRDYDVYFDFDLAGAGNIVEEIMPFPNGARKDQVLKLEFFSYDGNPVEYLGNTPSQLPYFETKYLTQEREKLYPNGTKFVTTTQNVTGGYDYEVDTTAGSVVLTVPANFDATFSVSDADQSFLPSNSCTVDFTAYGQGLRVLQSSKDAYKFYWDGSQWRYKDLDTKAGGVV